MKFTEAYPSQYESRVTLKNGKEVFLRPIKQSDSTLELDLFNKLSDHSKYLRFLRNLHTFPDDMLYRFTHLNYDSEFALVSVINENGKDAIIAVARYANNPQDNLTDLAVAVRDDWQNLGLGKLLLKKIVDIAREHSLCRFGSMIDTQNKVIRHILLELGYNVSYTLKDECYIVKILV